MTTDAVPSLLLTRLRDNLRAAAIPATDADIEGIIEKGFLSRLLAFEQLVEQTPSDSVPDYLVSWGAADPPDAASDAPARPSHVVTSPARDTTIEHVAAALRQRQVSPVELVEQALARIARRDAALNVFQLLRAEQARAAARRAEAEIVAGQYRGPLHGIPVAVKDLMAMAGTPTTAGSKILADNVTTFDASAVVRLEAAGAIIIGKTRMSEFAYSPGSNNGHYGPTRNPWNLSCDSGGSSSGSAVAVADGMVYAALGSDTGGSIRIPATHCGVIGLKPTFGRISLHGVFPLSWSLDHLGPLTRSVADAALLLGLLAGYDPLDPRTRRGVPAPDGGPALDSGVAGLRIGVLRDDGSGAPLASAEVLAAWRAGLKALEQQGAHLVEVDVPDLEVLRLLNGAILAMEATALHQANLRTRLDEFGTFMRQRILAGFAYGPGTFARAQQTRALARQRCDALFTRIDLLSTPPQPAAAPLLDVPSPTVFTGPFNCLGWPAITVPTGLSATGVPLAIQLVGKPWDEARLLRAAYAVEQALPLPAPPEQVS